MKIGDQIEGTIETVAFGGDGIMRHHGRVVFVPLTAPGDRVAVRVVSERKRFVRAELEEILEKGPARVEAPCPYFGQCGGCQLQHLSRDEQDHYKKASVIDCIERLGRLKMASDFAFVPAEQRWHYRRTAKFTLEPEGEGFRLGYVRRDLEGVLPIERCPILFEDDDSLLSDLAAVCRRLPCSSPVPPQLRVAKADASGCDVVLHFAFPGRRDERIDQILADLVKEWPRCKGILISDERSPDKELGSPSCTFRLGELVLAYDIRSFVQAHPEQSAVLYRDVAALVASKAPERVLDLYSGVGVTPMLFARDGATVCAVEGNSHAARLAESNLAANAIEGVEVICADVDQVFSSFLQKFVPNLLFVNPPRSGLHDKVIDALKARPVPLVAYVSCMPSTLARDVAALCEAGYRFTYCRAYDLFPQTAHVETLLLLEFPVGNKRFA